MTIYIDISKLDRGRANTGIQRVVKEFLQRAVSQEKNIAYKIISYNYDIESFELLDNSEIKLFLKDIKNFKFTNTLSIDLKKIKVSKTTILFDMDSLWGSTPKRLDLYPILKENGFLIFNFIYDLVPIVLPHLSHNETVINFKPYLDAIYKYSDMVFFDSLSAKNDFLKQKDFLKNNRNIATRVVGLGSDFLQNKKSKVDYCIKEILDKKYILFVGTIEPRKNQEEMLDAFEVLAKKYPDLNLVFIGRAGWKVDALIHRITTSELKDKQLYWFNDIDDDTLTHFYKNAFIVTYLSKYEGYGLPIAESLKHGNITITSKNSSMYEVGRDIADYIIYNSKNELVDMISLYYDNKEIYKSKKEYIKKNFKATTWDMMYSSIENVFNNFEKSVKLKENHRKDLQFVFISIDLKNLKGTLKAISKHVDFVKEYIIITAPKFVDEFKQIETDKKLTIIDETSILKEYTKDFHKRDHQSKNWLLRASLLNLDILDDEFIMLDDDNRPLKDITIDKFISKDGSYNAYYFYNLLEWNHKGTQYDIGQQNMKRVLSDENYELLSYSSHAPQIINKMIFEEAVNKFFQIGLNTPIDEWSIYFNYAISTYPYTFNNKVFETLSWPASLYDWEWGYEIKDFSFENYYEELYKNGKFSHTNTYEEKISIKQKEMAPFIKSKEIFKENTKVLSLNNMVHGVISFENKDIQLYLSSIPYYIFLEENSAIRLKLNYKLLNHKMQNLDISIVVCLNGNPRYIGKISLIDNVKYQESIVEVPIVSSNLKEGIYDITFDIKVNKQNIYMGNSPYLMKLIVIKKEGFSEYLKEKPLFNNAILNKEFLKNKIKKIPFLGWFSRFVYNILRINNLKHIVFIQKKRIEQLEQQNVIQQKQNNIFQERINSQKKQMDTFQERINSQKKQMDTFLNTIDSKIAKEMFYQSLSVQQRMDQFIFDSKIQSKGK